MDDQFIASLVPPSQKTVPFPQRLDNRSIAVILLLVLFYPLGVILMWAWMKLWPIWMKVVISLLLILGLIGIVISLSLLLPNSSFSDSAYRKSLPTEVRSQIEQKSTGNKVFDEANDVARESNIKIIDSSLKQYFAKYKKAPESLSGLIPEYISDEKVLRDIKTGEPLEYNQQDSTYGCIASVVLTTGETLYAYCK